MANLWDAAVQDALDHDTYLRPSELMPNMVVFQVNGDREHRVMTCLTCPDGFDGLGIVQTMDSHGYDQIFLFAFDGRKNDPIWIFLRWHVPSEAQK